MTDVFVSWTRAGDGGAWVRPLVEALRAAGLQVWFDEAEIGAFDAIPELIRTGLAASKVMVACYSAAYPSRRACREELTLALLVGSDSGRVLVVNPEPDAAHVVEAPLLRRRWAGPDELADLPALVARIAGQVAEVDGTFGELPGTEPAVWYGGEGWRGGSRRFVGRLDLLWRLHDRLTRTSQLAGGRGGRGVAIASGLGGIGKSLLAVEYAHLFASHYPAGVVWLSALGNDTAGNALPADQAQAAADNQWAVLAVALGLDPAGKDPAAVRQLVRFHLREGGRLLWIVDDLPTGLTSQQLAAWQCGLPNVAELITTRDRAHTRLDVVDVDVLEEADAYALLTQQRDLSAEEADQARELARDLGFHPLGCDVAGRYVAGGSSFRSYRRLIAGRLSEADTLAEAVADQLPGDHARTIAATLATSLAAIGSDAWLLLEIAGRLGPIAIPRTLLVSILDGMGGTPAEVRVGRALQDRHSDGLWRYDPDSQAVAVHVLVRAAAQALSPLEQNRPAIGSGVVIALTDALGNALDARLQRQLSVPAEHARYLAAMQERPQDGQLDLLTFLALYEYAGGRYPAAARLHQRIYDARRESLGVDHPHTLISAGNLAAVLHAEGDLTGATELQLHTYEARRRVLGDDHPDTLISANNLADTLRAAGNLTAAADLQQSTYDALRRVLGDDHPNILVGASNVAITLYAAGDLTGAIDLHQRTYETRRRLLGDDHPDTLVSANNLATVLHAKGDLTGAIHLQRSTYEALRQVLGDDHPNTLISANNLAATLRAAGDVTGAIDLQRSTYEALRQVLGDDHPNTITAANNLAAALRTVQGPTEEVN